MRVQTETMHTLVSKSLGSDAAEVKSYRNSGSLKTPKEKRSHGGSSFDRFPGFFQALDPRIKRNA